MSDEELVEALRRTFAADAAEVDAVPDVADVVVRRERRERRRLVTLGVVVALALVGTGVLLAQFQSGPARVDTPSEPAPSRSSDVAGPATVRRTLGPSSSFTVRVGDPTTARVGSVCAAAWLLDVNPTVAGADVGRLQLVVPLARSDEFAVTANVVESPPPATAGASGPGRVVVLAVSAPSGRRVTAEFADGRETTVDVQRELALLGAADENGGGDGPDPLAVTRLAVETLSGEVVELVGGGSAPAGVYGADGRLSREPTQSAVGCGGS